MKEFTVVLMKENVNWHGMVPSNFKAWMDDENCLWVSGSVRCDANENIGPYERHIKAAVCEVCEDKEKRVIYTLSAYEALDFDMTQYGTFTMRSANVVKQFAENAEHHIELFPEYKKEVL